MRTQRSEETGKEIWHGSIDLIIVACVYLGDHDLEIAAIEYVQYHLCVVTMFC